MLHSIMFCVLQDGHADRSRADFLHCCLQLHPRNKTKQLSTLPSRTSALNYSVFGRCLLLDSTREMIDALCACRATLFRVSEHYLGADMSPSRASSICNLYPLLAFPVSHIQRRSATSNHRDEDDYHACHPSGYRHRVYHVYAQRS